MNSHYESENDKMIWWNVASTVDTIASYRAESDEPVRVWYDRRINGVCVGCGTHESLWVCKFKTLPTQEEISAVVDLVKVKYL